MCLEQCFNFLEGEKSYEEMREKGWGGKETDRQTDWRLGMYKYLCYMDIYIIFAHTLTFTHMHMHMHMLVGLACSLYIYLNFKCGRAVLLPVTVALVNQSKIIIALC